MDPYTQGPCRVVTRWLPRTPVRQVERQHRLTQDKTPIAERQGLNRGGVHPGYCPVFCNALLPVSFTSHDNVAATRRLDPNAENTSLRVGASVFEMQAARAPRSLRE